MTVLMARDHFRIVSELWVKDAIEKVVCGGRASFGLGANVVTSQILKSFSKIKR